MLLRAEDIELTTLDMHIDWRSLQRLSEGNAKFELDLLRIFVQDSCNHLALLDSAIEKRQFDEIEQIAHHLKGASANVGAFVMRDAAHELERQSRRRSLDEPELLITAIRESLSYIQAFIQTGA